VLNGFMIFLTATAWPVSWSLAELSRGGQSRGSPRSWIGGLLPDETKGSHPHGLEIGVPRRHG
jgi:hypothetical protein